MSEYNNYTRIFTSINVESLELCDGCEWSKDCYDEWGYETPPHCDCPYNPLSLHKIVNVRVAQKPIKTAPKDTSFDIRIWEIKERQNDVSYEDIIFNRQTPTLHFTLENTINPIDLEILYKENVKKYLLPSIRGDDNLNKKKFKGTCSIESYVLAFNDLVNNISTSIKQREQPENPHINRKKKKKK